MKVFLELRQLLRITRQHDGAKYALILDLLWAVVRGDWHRVSDDANDIRVMEAT